MIEFEKLNDLDYATLFDEDTETLTKLNKKLFGFGLIRKVLIGASVTSMIIAVLSLVMDFACLLVIGRFDRGYTFYTIGCALLSAAFVGVEVLQEKAEKKKTQEFMQTAESSDYKFICDMGKLDYDAKLYGDTLCVYFWKLCILHDKPYLIYKDLSMELTEEEYFDLSRYGIDKFVVIRHVYDRVQKNGKAVSHEDLMKKLVD